MGLKEQAPIDYRVFPQLEPVIIERARRIVNTWCRNPQTALAPEDAVPILAALGLIDPPPVEPAPTDNTIEYCPNGHPKTPENLRRTNRGSRCRTCENIARQRRRERQRAEGTGQITTPRGTTNYSMSDAQRNTAVNNAAKALGISGRKYKLLYGASGAIAEAVIEAAAENNTEILERLKKENR